MTSTSILFLFVLIFGVVLGAVFFGFRFLESQKRKKVSQMLQTAGGDAAQVQTKVLIEPEKPMSQALANFLDKFNVVRQLDIHIQQAGMTTSVYNLLIVMVLLLIPGAVVGAMLKAPIYPAVTVAAVAILFAFAPYLYVRRTRTKRLAAFEEQFPEALDFLARAMRAGHAFSISLEMLSDESPQPLGQEFRKVFNEHSLGLPVETALHNLQMRVPLLDVGFFVSAVLLQRETGGNLSEILTKLAVLIRERFKLKGAVKAASAHGRLTGTILTLMPICLMAGLIMVAPGYLQGMVKDSTGRVLIFVCIVLMLIGHMAIKKIVNIKV